MSDLHQQAGAAAGLVILGSGLGGYTLAREFRKLDRDTPVTLITADGGESYSKPMLSNAFAQNKDAGALVQKTADQMATDLSLTVLSRHLVESLDPADRAVVALAPDGRTKRISYDRLVLALGADPRHYRVPGSEDVTVHSVNDLDDYANWRGELGAGARVLLIGAGLIGCEFANDLAGAGYQVSLVDPAPWPLGRLLPEVVGRELQGALEGAGIAFHLRHSVASLRPGVALLDSGVEVAFDHALSAIGLLPRVLLAEQAGLAVDKGIVVDRLLRTSDPAIFALGDCAQSPAGLLPFVLPLMAQARALAATLAGRDTQLSLPALPVAVKTPALPVAVCPPAPGSVGEWQIEGEGRDRKALFRDVGGKALGFALSGSFAGQRQALAKEMPEVLS